MLLLRGSGVTLLLVIVTCEVTTGLTTKQKTVGNETLVASESRVKRGYSSGHSTGIAYNRINDAGQIRLRQRGGGHRGGYHDEDEGGGHRGGGGGGGGHGGGGHENPIGEDGTHTNDFKSYGVGYEHRNTEHCEESKCGYNIRHCPHGCVFNSLECGGGRAYDTCCC
ncbi:glycine-rich protein DC9.1 [Folsomia candida]|uniref:Uncharacterized protein n=1 Tax=Folsomia candida TaxID=158441 RepID=A0A226DCX0_FOLCA|nr:glycine-rich protein DC9.1 [Folsomia candida]OXA43372.1 hypothetical protein Fcan01_21767 [Folsomia candida]